MFPYNELNNISRVSPAGEATNHYGWGHKTDFVMGPRDLLNPFFGLTDQVWEAGITEDKNNIYLVSEDIKEYIIESAENITEVSIAFNTSARLHYAFITNGKGWFVWWDTITASSQRMCLGDLVINPKVFLDDPRGSMSGRADIILVYIKYDGKLYFRKARDRFDIEYLLAVGPFKALHRIYIGENSRIHFVVETNANAAQTLDYHQTYLSCT